ncbi:MAG: Transcription antitermination protein NusB [Mycoplasmataceae bacterium]|nr:MAG: Transcription antitermination protein NusB [Mycoplasmataceae bacterium]
MFRLDKRKIFLLYQYYLLGNTSNTSEEVESEKEKNRIIWLNECLKKEKLLKEKINKKLKAGWDFSQSPPLEKSILIYSAYELISGKNTDLEKMIIDQTINFSKVYLEEEKFKYINKILDLIIKEK